MFGLFRPSFSQILVCLSILGHLSLVDAKIRQPYFAGSALSSTLNFDQHDRDFSTLSDSTSQYPIGLGKHLEKDGLEGSCAQVDALHPKKHAGLWKRLEGVFDTKDFKHLNIESLAGAVQVPTESYDDMLPVGQDSRWDIFGKLGEYFRERFPLTHAHLHLTKVNKYGLVYHWQGQNDSLPPILLAGHQDVVPVEPATVDQWEYPPYSGAFDGTWVWGRGACDDKGSVVSIFTTVETLLHQGFQPERTTVIAFGFDEEASGRQGAGKIAGFLESRYGKHTFAALLDEGGGFGTPLGKDVVFAMPCTSEKGYIDVRIEVTTPGGHSSVPPKHTGIGILSAAVVAIEDSSHEPQLPRTGTPFTTIQCFAAHGPEFPPTLRKLAEKAATDDDALELLKNAIMERDEYFGSILTTTQAVDIIQGGVKVNALPEKTSAVVNHRIAEHSSVEEVQSHLTSVLTPIAKRFNLTLNSFGKNVTAGSGSKGHIELTDAYTSALQPSPVTPTHDAAPYDILAGTIQATFEDSKLHHPKKVVVAPTLAGGNTDTQFYWNLTKHIYRYSHFAENDAYGGIHTVNEAVRADSLVEEVRFLAKFILNWDESTYTLD